MTKKEVELKAKLSIAESRFLTKYTSNKIKILKEDKIADIIYWSELQEKTKGKTEFSSNIDLSPNKMELFTTLVSDSQLIDGLNKLNLYFLPETITPLKLKALPRKLDIIKNIDKLSLCNFSGELNLRDGVNNFLFMIEESVSVLDYNAIVFADTIDNLTVMIPENSVICIFCRSINHLKIIGKGMVLVECRVHLGTVEGDIDSLTPYFHSIPEYFFNNLQFFQNRFGQAIPALIQKYQYNYLKDKDIYGMPASSVNYLKPYLTPDLGTIIASDLNDANYIFLSPTILHGKIDLETNLDVVSVGDKRVPFMLNYNYYKNKGYPVVSFSDICMLIILKKHGFIK